MTGAKGFQGDQLSIQGGEATNLDIVLKAIRVAGSSVMRGKVISEDGKPIGRVEVHLAPGQPGLEEVNWATATDAEGRFAWASAPDHPAKLLVGGSIWDWEEQQLELAPDVQEAVITLKPKAKILVHGTVTDRSTGRLLPEFKVLWAPGIRSGYAVHAGVLIEVLTGRHHMGDDYNSGRFFHFSAWSTIRCGNTLALSVLAWPLSDQRTKLWAGPFPEEHRPSGKIERDQMPGQKR
jgi:hypothetical protein